jgi:hypothetical protein
VSAEIAFVAPRARSSIARLKSDRSFSFRSTT